MDNVNEEVEKKEEILEEIKVEEIKKPETNEMEVKSVEAKSEEAKSEEVKSEEVVEKRKNDNKRRAKHKEKLEKMTEEERLEYRKRVRRRKARMDEKSGEHESTEETVTSEGSAIAEEFTEVIKRPTEEAELVHEEKATEEKDEQPLHLGELEGNELKEFATVVKDVMWCGLGNPVAAMKQAEESRYRTEFIFGGMFLLLVFITTSIHIPVLQSIFGVMGRMQIALIAVMLVTIIIASMVGTLYVFAKKKQENLRVRTILGAFSISLIPGIIAILVSFILGYLSVVGVALVLVISFIYWILLCSQICAYYLEKDVFLSNIVMVLASIIIFFVVYFAIKLTALQALTMMINTSTEAVQAADGTIVGSAEAIVEKVIQFLRDVDTLLGN